MSPPDSFNDCNFSRHRKLRLVRLRALQSGVGESRSKPPLRLLLCSWTESLDSLPRGALELPLLLRLLPELLVMVFAEVHASRLPDQLELGEGLLPLCGGEGSLRFLPTTDDPAQYVCGHGPDDTDPDICMCAVGDVGIRQSATLPDVGASAPPRPRQPRGPQPLPPPSQDRTPDSGRAGERSRPRRTLPPGRADRVR